MNSKQKRKIAWIVYWTILAAGIILQAFTSANILPETDIGWNILKIEFLVGFWYCMSLRGLPSGQYIDIGNLGGGYIRPKLGYMPGFIINDPESVNFDSAYPKYEVIPLKEVPAPNGEHEYRWGSPGYEEWQPGDQRPMSLAQTATGVPEPLLYQIWKEDRPFLERQLSYVFIGFWPFRRILTRKVTVRKMVPYDTAAKLFSGNPNDRNDYEDEGLWSGRWKDVECIHALISRQIDRSRHPLFSTEVIVSKELETGGKTNQQVLIGTPGSHDTQNDPEDELLQIDIVTELQTRVTNPFEVYTKSPNPIDSIDAATQSGMRVYVAHLTIDDFQKENHLAKELPDGYQGTIESLNGKWTTTDTGESYLTPGLMLNSGVKINSKKVYLKSWSPSNERSRQLLAARQELFIAKQKRTIAQIEGKAAGERVQNELDAKRESLVKYENAVRALPVDNTRQAELDALTKLGGGNLQTLVISGDNNPITQTLGLNNGNNRISTALPAPDPTDPAHHGAADHHDSHAAGHANHDTHTAHDSHDAPASQQQHGDHHDPHHPDPDPNDPPDDPHQDTH